jgi:RNA polymerase II C-terminal domain phosphatase-like 1/2
LEQGNNVLIYNFSLEDRIDALQRKLGNEIDPQHINGMLPEIKRYQDDKSILKQ